MEAYLEKRMFVYRKSYKFYSKISLLLLILKLLFSSVGLTAFYYLPLSYFGLGSGFLEILEKFIKERERLSEFQISYKFYRQMIHLFKSKKITEEEINIREKEFIDNMTFFPREKYLKQAELNGYNYV